MPDRITQAELFRRVIDDRLRELHVALPAEVTAVDMAAQTVDARPVVARSVPRGDGDDLPPALEELPTIQAVPLVFPRGGGYYLTTPVQKGDYVLLIFAERDIGRWRSTGTAGTAGDQRMHPLSGAMAIAGVFPTSQALTDASSENLTFGKDGGVTVAVTPSRMEVDGAGDSAALASRVKTLENAILTHTHVSATPGNPSGTPVFVTAPPGDYKSTVLKVGS